MTDKVDKRIQSNMTKQEFRKRIEDIMESELYNYYNYDDQIKSEVIIEKLSGLYDEITSDKRILDLIADYEKKVKELNSEIQDLIKRYNEFLTERKQYIQGEGKIFKEFVSGVIFAYSNILRDLKELEKQCHNDDILKDEKYGDGYSTLGGLTCPQCHIFMCIPKEELKEEQQCPYCNCNFTAEQDKVYINTYNTKIINGG